MIENITAFLIHSRDYKNNSKLLDFLTDDFGLIRMVGSGIKNSKDKIQHFLKLRISFSGKNELKSLRSWEIEDTPRYIQGEILWLMIYINELIIKLSPNDKLHLCGDYAYLVKNLNTNKKNNQWQLRLFENEFLAQIGYGIDFYNDVAGIKINEHIEYAFIMDKGFTKLNGGIKGKQLLLVAKKIMPSDVMLRFCKQINQQRIDHILQGRILQSKRLFKYYY